MIRKHLAILTAYAALSVVLSFPLVLNFVSAIPGIEGDAASFVWALGWVKVALSDWGINPYRSDFVFYPLGGATQLLWAVSLIAFLSIPLQALVGLIAAHNFLYLAATVLTAYGMFLLFNEVLQSSEFRTQNSVSSSRPLPPFATFLIVDFIRKYRQFAPRPSPLAPFTAGLVFAFAPLRLGYGLSFFNLFNTQDIPFYVLFLLRATRRQSRRDALLAGLFLAANAYVDFQIAAFLVLLTALYLVYSVLTHPNGATTQIENLRALVPLWCILALTALTLVAPLLAVLADDFAIEGGNYIRVYNLDYSRARAYDLLAYFVPNARSALYAAAPLKIANVNTGNHAGDGSAESPDRQAFVGYVALALAAYATMRQWRQARFWVLVALLFALFSLGPALYVFGRDTGIPLPFLALHEIPIVNHIRIPMRYGIMVPFAVAVLVGIGVRRLEVRGWTLEPRGWRSRVGRVAASCLLPAAILLEYAVLPYPIQPVSIPAVYEQIARVPGDFSVLEIPTFHWRGAAQNELYQAIHGKRILRAYTNRVAPGPAEYFAFRGTPIVVRSLRMLEGAEKGELTSEQLAEDKRVRDEVLSFFNLRYAVLHRSYLKPEQAQATDVYLRDVLAARSVYDDGETLGYELPRRANGDTRSIDLRESVGQMYAGRGWQFEYPPANWDGQFNFVWTRGARSEIYFVAQAASERTMKLHAYAATPQSAIVSLNGARVGEIELTPEWRAYPVLLPAALVRAGMNRVDLNYGAELTETVGVTTIQIEVADGSQTSR